MVEGEQMPVVASARAASGGARRSGAGGLDDDDHAVHDRLVTLLTEGAPVHQVIDLVPAFGEWRFPSLPFAVGFDGLGLPRQVVGRPGAQELFRALVPLAPWTRSPRPPEASGLHISPAVRGTVAELDVPGKAIAAEHGMTQWAVLPVRADDGITGAVIAGWTQPGGPTVASVEKCLRLMARSTALVLEWHLQRAALERAMSCDPLTGVANRQHLFAGLETTLARARGPAALLHLDIDRFKAVNDAWGHAVGDAVLVEVVRRIEALLRPGDLLGRIAGDELLVLCSGLDSRMAAEALARSAVEAVARPITVGDVTVEVAVSIGVAIADRVGPRPIDADDLLARADGALYVAKGAGGGRMVVTAGVGGLDGRQLPRR